MNAQKNEQKPRITIYCNDEEQKEYISSRLEILKNRFGVKTNSDVIEHLIKDEIKFLERFE